MIKLITLSKASEAKAYLEGVLKKLEGVKINAIFSACPFFSSHAGYRRYEDRSPIYILFENEQCLVIDYPFIDELCVELRVLNEDEKALLEKVLIKDFFNCSVDIHKYEKKKSVAGEIDRWETISLEYGTVVAMELRPVTEEYSKWIDGDLDFAKPTAETFDQIKFIMSNGNTFIICADDADVNGYVMAWSTDAKKAII